MSGDYVRLTVLLLMLPLIVICFILVNVNVGAALFVLGLILMDLSLYFWLLSKEAEN